MGLQVRVRHALGARMVEIEARGPDRPLRLGRDAQCDLQVPSGAVLPVHAILYVHDEQWVVSKADPSAPLAVNGQAVEEPVFVNPGDVISLGAGVGGATLELDPLRTARRGAAAVAARPSLPEQMPAEPAMAEPAPGEEQVAWAADAPAGAAEEGEEAWPASPRPFSYRRVRPRVSESTRSNVLIAGVLVVVVLVGTAGFVTYKLKSRAARQAPRQVVLPDTSRREAADEPLGTGGSGSIFDFPDDRSRNKPQPQPRRPVENPRPTPRNPNPAPVGPSSQSPAPAPDGGVVTAEQETGRPEPVPDNDPRKQTPEWKNIQEASRRLDADSQVRLIWACQDHLASHPGAFEKELNDHIAGALDLLWWMRIKDLCDRRAALQAQIEKIDRDIKEESPDSEFRAKFVKERKDREYELNSTVESLANDMGYAGMVVPNILNTDELDDLRRKRDAAKFEKWSKRVTDHIRLRHRAPWQ